MIDSNDTQALVEMGALVPPPDNIGYLNGVYGQNLYDICLMTYGTLDLLMFMLEDNGIANINQLSAAGITFHFDKTKVKNAAIFTQNFKYNIVYATFNPPPDNFFIIDTELRDDGTIEFRDDLTNELR